MKYSQNEEDKKPLIVCFGGYWGGFGGPVFEFKNFLSSNFDNCDFIFIRDLQQAWYFKGMDVKDFNIAAKNTDDNFEVLKNILKREKYSKVIFLGNSMGGYAAILYGILLNVDCVLSFSTQTFISSEKRKKHGDDRWSEQINSLHKSVKHHKHFDLFNLRKQNYKTTIRIFIGSEDKLDAIHGENIKEMKNVSICIEKGNHHHIKRLRNNGRLYEILQV